VDELIACSMVVAYPGVPSRRAAPGRVHGRDAEPLVVERVAVVWEEG
jgi:hypothetical protein